MKRYLFAVSVAWGTMFLTFKHSYRSLSAVDWLAPVELMAIFAVSTSFVLAFAAGMAEVMSRFTGMRKWLRIGAAAIASGVCLGALAFTLGVYDFGYYEWPGWRGLGIVLFREYRMLNFLFEVVPVTSVVCALLTLTRITTSGDRR